MFGIILLTIGIVGFGLAAYWDLKTTEFPDWLPYSMIILALIIRIIFSFLSKDLSILTDSLFVGFAFLGFGLLLYYTKQWGDGDAWLLGTLGFLFPNPSGLATQTHFLPFPIIMLFNFFFIAFIYLIAYSLFLGFRSPNVSKLFFRELRGSIKSIVVVIAVFSLACILLIEYVYFFYEISLPILNQIMLFPFLLFAVILFVHYGKFIEKKLFKKRIHVKKLRPGDVPATEKWRVLSKKEICVLQKRGGHIWIKEGVRFAPVFIITMLVTLFYGNLILLFLV